MSESADSIATPPGKRFITTCLAKGGVGKTTTLFHLLRWYSMQLDGRIRIYVADPDGRSQSLSHLTGGEGDFKAPYPATVVNPMRRKELFPCTGCLRKDEADVSALDGVGSGHKEIIDENWFDFIEVPEICAEIQARLTLILIIDNTARVYRECLKVIKKYADRPNVDFVVFHIRRDSADEITRPGHAQLYADFLEGAGGHPGVKKLLPNWDKRYAMGVIPHIDADVENYIFGARGTLHDLFNHKYIDDVEWLRVFQKLWRLYYAAFDQAAPLLLPLKQAVEVSR